MDRFEGTNVTLSAGTRLGPYEIVAPLGAGGMGEVWRAKDTHLGREVAVKVLPERTAGDPEALARFEREARILASLNHPNIAVIHGLHHAEGIRFLAMELVAGEDLARRIQRGALPVEEALAIGRQVAEALEAAHESGVIHRDLKPANIQLTPDGKVKVLDFGLAKAFETESRSGGPSMSPTLTSAGTRAGMILGTAAYMSPEQARGRVVDRRADIWAFGCVLYEMLAGQAPFRGETITDTLAAVVRGEPDWTLLPEGTPSRVAGLLKRCLRKEAKERLRDIGDARLELAEAMAGAPEAAPAIVPAPVPPHRAFTWAGLAIGLLAGALGTFAALRVLQPAAPASTLRKFSLPIPQLSSGFTNAARISPDGNFIVYSSHSRLWVRDLRRFEGTEIPGSEGATSPFWSADGAQIGFAKDKKIWTWTLTGGQSTPICAIPGVESFNHAAWGKDGKIFFAAWRGGLYEVAAAGGDPRLLLSPDASEVDFHYPHLLPDGRHLVTVAHRKEGMNPVVVISLPGGERKDLKAFEGLGTVTYSPTGHLLLNFDQGRQKILAVPFSESKLEITGEPFLVAAGGQFPSVSATGLLVYYLGASYSQRELAWVDHDGRSTQAAGRPQLGLDTPALSPDGRKVAVVAYENDNADIWIQDLARGTRSRLVAGPQDEVSPVWSPAGDRIFYLRAGNVSSSLMEVPADGTGEPRSRAEGLSETVSSSPDGRTLVFPVEKAGHQSLWRLGPEAGAAPVRLTPNAAVQEYQPAISPDGRWLAYASDEAGPVQVFVRRFPDGGQKQQVSLNGGSFPFWGRTGKALYYWEGDTLVEVPVQEAAALSLGSPRKLFNAADIGLVSSDVAGRPALDMAADGRFLVVRRSSEDPRRGLLVVENWFEEFRKR